MPPNNHDYDGLMSEGTDVFDDWYFTDRATTDDEDPDTCQEDCFEDVDLH